jgi:uncharacterized protein (TIGR00252 family)
MNSTEAGRRAESAARSYLEMRGFKIVEQNFRRPRCEIDIIALKDNVMHLVEVKYRKNDDQGGGLAAITASKVKQMRYAAEIWAQEYKWSGEYILSAVEIAGGSFAVLSFVENVI